MYINFANLLLAAASISLGKLVAPITRISPLLGEEIPSNKTRNYVLILRDA
jgi:hypothetical protein